MCTISDFRELNKCILRKPYPIPKISTILQELEGLTYATAFHLNMGYYTIRLDPTASKMWTIIFPWGEYFYKRLTMGFGGSAKIFHAQIMDLMASLGFCTSIHGWFGNHHKRSTGWAPSKLETLLARLCDAGLKVNAAKSLFCAHEIECLRYILTRDGIKPQPQKVQAILALSPPNNFKELRYFLGMVQYCRDMWTSCSEPLSLT